MKVIIYYDYQDGKGLREYHKQGRRMALSLRDEFFISFDGGKTIVSLHKDANAMKKALNRGIIRYNYERFGKDCYAFWEIIQATDEVSPEVLNVVAKRGKRYKLNIDGAMSLFNHPSVFQWLLDNGVKCKYVPGHGSSTMENFFRKARCLWLPDSMLFFEYVKKLKEYDAVDVNFLNNKEARTWYPEWIFKAFES